MQKKSIDELMQRRQVQDSIRQEFEGTLQDRVTRYLQVKPHEIVPNTHFAAVSAECSLLFRDGHYYGCISLSQSVAEALVRFLCQKNSWRPANGFEQNVRKLHTRNVISKELQENLLQIWGMRDDYHHLNPTIEADRLRLEELAKEKIGFLVRVEREVFAYTVQDGSWVPKNPQYFDVEDNTAHVFLRFDP